MEGNVETLLRENAQLRQENAELAHARSELSKRVEILAEQIAWFKHRFFARSSEALSEKDKRQLRLFDEVESSRQADPGEDLQALIRIPQHTRGKARRRPLPEVLPREEVVIDIPEEQKRCQCGAELVRIGEEVSEKLDVIPPQLRVIRTVRPKYACHDCEGSGDEQRPAVRIAAMPPALIDKGIASAGLLAYIVTSKFCDCLPLYRQEKQFERIGVELSRRTMADWMIAASEACAPLVKVLEDRLRSGPLLQLDETTVQVMDEPGRENTTVSYMWVAPKPSGLQRPITLLCFEDQILLQAVANLLVKGLLPRRLAVQHKSAFANIISDQPADPFVLQHWRISYRAFQWAISRAFSSGLVWVASFDLAAFYDTISHVLLLRTAYPHTQSADFKVDKDKIDKASSVPAKYVSILRDLSRSERLCAEAALDGAHRRSGLPRRCRGPAFRRANRALKGTASARRSTRRHVTFNSISSRFPSWRAHRGSWRAIPPSPLRTDSAHAHPSGWRY